MCGIAGFVEVGGPPAPMPERELRVEAMGAQIAHRGPDEATTLHWRNVSIAFRRLSINDPEQGSQPFHSPDGAVSTFVNGELYNHAALRATLDDPGALRTRSDCEVLPQLFAAHGAAAFERINGMFAAVILDRTTRQLVLARDRMGIKPLFFSRCRFGVVFGSELKAVLAHPEVRRQFDWTRALQFQSWPMAGAECLPSGFVGIDCVPPGGFVRIDLEKGSISSDRYWCLDQAAASLEPPLRAETPERFRALLADSVRARLMADVEVGLFLSGGIDSAALAALAAPHRRLQTFSVWNGATRASGDAAASFRSARACGLPNHAVRVDLDDAPSPADWRNLLWACELHSITAEQWFKFRLHAYARALDADLKVILLGQGADEFLGGYLYWLTGIRRGADRSAWEKVDHALERDRRDDAIAAGGVAHAYRPWFEAGWLDAGALAGPSPPAWERYRARYRTNLDYHLWHEDRTAAAHGIENRVPFLDHRLLEFLASIPTAEHPRWFSDKMLLRRAMQGLLPDALVQRPKGYFFYGTGQVEAYRMIAGMLEADSGSLFEQALAGSRRSDGPLTGPGLQSMRRRVLQDPALRGITSLLHLVNMGVLADLAADIETVARVQAGRMPERFDEASIEVALEGIADGLDDGLDDASAVDDDAAVYALSSNLSLLEMVRPSDGESAAGTLVLVEDNRLVQDVMNRDVALFLQSIDGRRSLAEIVEDERLDRGAIRAALPEALELGLLARLR